MSSYHRVKSYVVYSPSYGESTCEFTDAQAREVGGALQPDGLCIKLACRLVDFWNKRARGGLSYSIRHTGGFHND